MADNSGGIKKKDPLISADVMEVCLDIAGVIIVVLDTEGNIALLNRRAEEVLGYDRDDILGKSWFETFLPVELQEKTKKRFLDTISGKIESPAKVEGRIVAKDGEERLILWESSILKDEDGSVTGILSSGNDITESRRAEEEVKKRLEIGSCISEISRLLISEENPDINLILKILGETIGVNRIHIYSFGEDYKRAINTHEWLSPKAKPLAKKYKYIATDDYKSWMNKISSGEYIVIKDPDSLPPEVYAEKELIKSGNILSLLAIPLYTKAGRLTGFIAFNQSEEGREWPYDIIEGIKIICEMLEMHWEIEKEKSALELERRQLLSIFESFTEIVYVTDPETYEVLYVNNAARKAFGKNSIGGICYEEFQNLDSPCPFCTNEIILKDKYSDYHWEFHNPVLNRNFMLTDRIIKWPDGRDVRFEIAIDITERKKAERELRESEEKFRNIFETSRDVIYLSTIQGRFIDINPSAQELFGHTKEELLETGIADICRDPKDWDVFKEKIKSQGFVKDYELVLKRKNKTFVDCVITATVRRDKEGKATGYQGTIKDISEKKRLEEQLLRTQKMEAIGTLAGGIAHDFNNILATIMGYSSYITNKIEEDHPFYEGIKIIEDSSKRASELTSQLLTFSRRGKVEVKTVNLNRIVKDIHNLISKTFDRSIKIVLQTEIGQNYVEGDESQLSQVVMNLVINARDAMPGGGTLNIQTFSKDFISPVQIKDATVRPGEYICLSVSDSGEGMEKETQDRVFEPYFTTKIDRGGTGLGLSVVFGIVEKHHGFIDIISEKGVGTEVIVCLPKTREMETERLADKSTETLRGSETILVIENEKDLVTMIKTLLKDYGYTVFTAGSCKSAVRTSKEKQGVIDLVLLNISMPEMESTKVLEKILAINPEAKVLLLSDYSKEDQLRELLGRGAGSFIAKPFVGQKLLEKIREMLK